MVSGGNHLSHNGQYFFSIKARDEADKAHAKASSKGKGDRNRAPKAPNSRGGPVGGGGLHRSRVAGMDGPMA